MLVVADPAASDLGCEVESPIFKEILSSKVSFAALSSSRTEAEMVTSYGVHDSEVLVVDRATSQHLLKARPADFKVIHSPPTPSRGDAAHVGASVWLPRPTGYAAG